MAKLVIGDLRALKKKDDVKGFYTRKIFKQVKELFEKTKICERCGECELRVVDIFNSEIGEILAWDCYAINSKPLIVLTTTEGKSFYDFD